MTALLCALLLAAPAAAAEDAPLRLAMSSPLGEEQARKDAVELSAVLSAALHRKVVAEVASPKTLPGLLARGVVDLGWLSAAQYIDATAAVRKGQVVPAAKLVRGGLPFYRSAIFIREKGPVKKLTDLKGKRIAFTSEQSSTGYFLPRQLLLSAGFSEADLRGGKFFGDHAGVCRAVLEDKAEAGATFANDGRGGGLAGCEETLGAEKTRELKVLATSDPIPNDVIALKPQSPPELVAAVRAALVALSGTPEGKEKLSTLFHADAFVPAEDSDFTLLRDLRR